MNRRDRRGALRALPKRAPWESLERVPGAELHPQAPAGLAAAWNNHTYAVQKFWQRTPAGDAMHLMVRRHDGKPVRSWLDLQRIKNQVAGPEATAVEVFPASAELVDAANMYHLWVLPEGFTLPFGLHQA